MDRLASVLLRRTGRVHPPLGDAPPDGFIDVFCGHCGGALWSQSPENPEIISMRMGTFDADPGIRPSYRQYVAYAAPWEPIPDDGLPRFPEARKT